MIHVVFTEAAGILSLHVSGHAGAAPKGEDLVCAAASILTSTVAQAMMMTKVWLQEEPVITLQDGDGEIYVKPTEDKYPFVFHTFTVALIGFQLLAEKYPQYVTLRTFQTIG